MAKAVRSLEWRRKHSISMHRIITKLLKLRKLREKQFASEKTLKKRAQKLALIMMRKKVAGKSGGDYANMDTSQKMAIDRLLQHIPQQQITKLSTRLLPVIRKHEQERVKRVREDFEHVAEDATYKGSMRAMVSANLNKMWRAPRSASSMSTRLRGEGGKTKELLAYRTRLKAAETRFGLRGKGKQRFEKLARRMMVNHSKKSIKDRLSGIAGRIRRDSQRAVRSNRSDMSVQKYVDSHRRDAFLRQDFEYDAMADMIMEGTMDRFEALFIRGLVPRNRIEINKRIFRDLERNIKFRRFHDDITEMLEKLIKLITTDETIYNKITQTVQRRNHGNA